MLVFMVFQAMSEYKSRFNRLKGARFLEEFSPSNFPERLASYFRRKIFHFCELPLDNRYFHRCWPQHFWKHFMINWALHRCISVQKSLFFPRRKLMIYIGRKIVPGKSLANYQSFKLFCGQNEGGLRLKKWAKINLLNLKDRNLLSPVVWSGNMAPAKMIK